MKIKILTMSDMSPGKVFKVYSEVFGYSLSSTEKDSLNQNIMFTGRHVFKKDYAGEELYEYCRVKAAYTDSFQLISTYAKAVENIEHSTPFDTTEYIYEKFVITADGTYKSLGYYNKPAALSNSIITSVDEVSKFSVEELQTLAKIFSMEFPFYI